MKYLVLIIAALSSTAIAHPVNGFDEVARKMQNLKLTGCYTERAMTIHDGDRKVTVNRKSFEQVYRESGHDLATTLIALDAGKELCRTGYVKASKHN